MAPPLNYLEGLPVFTAFRTLAQHPGMSDTGFQAEATSESQSGVVSIALTARYPTESLPLGTDSAEAIYRHN